MSDGIPLSNMKPIETEITRMFGIKYPIIAAPMFLVSDVNLVAEVGECGGLGSFPALNYRPIENYRKAIQEIKAKTKAPFGINIIVQKSNKSQEEHLDIALEEGVKLIITSLGSPKRIIEKAHQGGTKVFCDVVGLEHAKKVEQLGADGLIAVGAGAGGHAGDISHFALIPYLKRNTKLPILAAGSIVDGVGMLAAFSLGASAIYMGTRFIASKESSASDDYKNAIVGSNCESIVNTDRVDGFPGNFIRTPLLEQLGIKAPLLEEILTRSQKMKRGLSLLRAGKALFASKYTKASYKTIFSAGHGVGLIDEVLPVSEIIQQTVAQYHQLKSQLP